MDEDHLTPAQRNRKKERDARLRRAMAARQRMSDAEIAAEKRALDDLIQMRLLNGSVTVCPPAHAFGGEA